MQECTTVNCQKPAAPGRRICWSCYHYRQRYGVERSELEAKRSWGGGCAACGKRKRYMDTSLGKPVCKPCWSAIKLARDPAWRRNVAEMIGMG